MNSTRRLIAIAGIVVVAAIGFVVAKASDDSSTPSSASQTVAVTQPGGAAATTPGPGTKTTPARRAAPAVPKIVVEGLKPVGGVKELVFRKGETIRFTVVSDQPEEIHLHGYDVAKDVAPGRPATFAVPAKIEGIFEAELEHSGTQIASITVEP